jgi:periplasmic protein TonB
MKYLFSVCFLLSLSNGWSQDKNQFYALDVNWNQTTLDSSKYILWIHEKEDSNWEWDFYNTWGPMIKSQSFADHDGTILNGRTYIYNKTGNVDSTCNFDHGKKNGSFYKYQTIREDSVITTMYYEYVADSLVRSINYMLDTMKKKKEDTTGTESEYPGGIAQWNYYLLHNLKYPDRAVNKEIQGQVRVTFKVDKEGKVRDAQISKSVEYSLDQESIRVIKDSGIWKPAMQHGELKNSYKLMPINYKLE